MHSAKDTENANARQTSHLITCTKPTSATTTPNKATSTITTQAKTVLTDAKPDASASAERKHATLGEIAGLPNQNQGEQPTSRRVAKDKSFIGLQLVRIRCTFIATKAEEIIFPCACNFLYCADSSYSETEILQAEHHVPKILDWNLGYPNPIHFLRQISSADQYNIQTRTIAKYLTEIQCSEWRLISAPPSLLVAASEFGWLDSSLVGKIGCVSTTATFVQTKLPIRHQI